MRPSRRTSIATLCLGALFAPLVGCQNLPGGSKAEATPGGASAGTNSGAGALADREKRGRAALIGGLVGAGGGYLIGSSVKEKEKANSQSADEAGRRARENPAAASQVAQSTSADLNADGFVTMDEVVAMQKAGLSEDDMIDRLKRTDQVFEMTQQQERYLADRGISQRMIERMPSLNRADGSTASSRARAN